LKKISFISLGLLIFIYLVINLFNNYNVDNSIVFIKSSNGSELKEGMGFVYEINGSKSYIVTNYHVVNDSESIYVYNLNNKKELAKIIEYDKYSDIAILEIESKLGLKKSRIGINNVKKSDSVYYFNIDKYRIMEAEVLDLKNEIILNTNYGSSLYNSVSIKGNIIEGNSGSPVFNVKNEVIGMISLKEENNNIGYYIPIDNVIDIVTKLKNHKLIRPNLGGIFVNTTNKEVLKDYEIDIAVDYGVVVLEVTKDYPLQLSGILKGDVITKIDNTVIEDVNELQKYIYSFNVGDTIKLEYYRDNVVNNVNIVLNK